MSDDRTYRLIKRRAGGTGSETAIRDAFAAKENRVTERDLPVVVLPAGTHPGIGAVPGELPRSMPPPRPPDLVEKRRFGNVELTIEHRGDEVTIVVPGVVRLVGSRGDALAMIEALAKSPVRPA
ncbi:MAG TPA: hypothetical protein VM261_30940 [Kofleriaceae bacterium]|nr:hypothetical protein [Kofleriaceae bacterium]